MLLGTNLYLSAEYVGLGGLTFTRDDFYTDMVYYLWHLFQSDVLKFISNLLLVLHSSVRKQKKKKHFFVSGWSTALQRFLREYSRSAQDLLQYRVMLATVSMFPFKFLASCHYLCKSNFHDFW